MYLFKPACPDGKKFKIFQKNPESSTPSRLAATWTEGKSIVSLCSVGLSVQDNSKKLEVAQSIIYYQLPTQVSEDGINCQSYWARPEENGNVRGQCGQDRGQDQEGPLFVSATDCEGVPDHQEVYPECYEEGFEGEV
jgi:hypothetical protein